MRGLSFFLTLTFGLGGLGLCSSAAAIADTKSPAPAQPLFSCELPIAGAYDVPTLGLSVYQDPAKPESLSVKVSHSGTWGGSKVGAEKVKARTLRVLKHEDYQGSAIDVEDGFITENLSLLLPLSKSMNAPTEDAEHVSVYGMLTLNVPGDAGQHSFDVETVDCWLTVKYIQDRVKSAQLNPMAEVDNFTKLAGALKLKMSGKSGAKP